MIEPVVVDRETVLKMKDMEPLDIGVTIDGVTVMRTASTENFEVMNLSNPRDNGCWFPGSTIEVTLLKPGTVVQLVVK